MSEDALLDELTVDLILAIVKESGRLWPDCSEDAMNDWFNSLSEEQMWYSARFTLAAMNLARRANESKHAPTAP